MAGEFTLLDHAKLFGEDGKLLKVVETLSKSDPIIADAITKESNSDNGHTYAVQTGLPEVVWRRAYEGVQPSKATQKVVHETYGRASTVSLVDAAVAEKGGKVGEVRASEAKRHLEAMSQELASKIIYGSNSVNEKSFIGFAERYNSGEAVSARNIINHGGTGDHLSSIYLIGWSADKIFTFYPKGSKAGIINYDYSPTKPIDITDAYGNTYPGYKEQYECLMGMAVADWRYGARICNINTAALTSKANCAALYESFVKALNSIQNFNGIKLVAYASRNVKFALRNGFLAANQSGVLMSAPSVQQNNNLTSTGNQGYSAYDLVIDGVHVKIEDAIVENEAQVTGF